MSEEFKSRLYLVKNGIPFDVAFSLDHINLSAFCIAFGELDGNKFDFRTMRFIQPQEKS